MKENKLLKPAILYKGEIEEKYCEYFYSREMYQVMGCFTSAIPPIKASGNDPGFRQFAIVDLKGNCIGYLHYTIYFDRRLVCDFELFGFNSSPLIGKALYDEINRLSHTYHLITFGSVGSNPAIKHYMNICKKLKGSYVVERDVIMDNECNFDDHYKFQILNPDEKYLSNVKEISMDYSDECNTEKNNIISVMKNPATEKCTNNLLNVSKIPFDIREKLMYNEGKNSLENISSYITHDYIVRIKAIIEHVDYDNETIKINTACSIYGGHDTIDVSNSDMNIKNFRKWDEILINAYYCRIQESNILKVVPLLGTSYPYNWDYIDIENVYPYFESVNGNKSYYEYNSIDFFTHGCKQRVPFYMMNRIFYNTCSLYKIDNIENECVDNLISDSYVIISVHIYNDYIMDSYNRWKYRVFSGTNNGSCEIFLSERFEPRNFEKVYLVASVVSTVSNQILEVHPFLSENEQNITIHIDNVYAVSKISEKIFRKYPNFTLGISREYDGICNLKEGENNNEK